MNYTMRDIKVIRFEVNTVFTRNMSHFGNFSITI